ncbi:hypothetical protein CMI46_02335 [Candidatus Pacearchaeota archaeon]|nr:hypothetical protein [Candidatus Pacearchaeota archaeon]
MFRISSPSEFVSMNETWLPSIVCSDWSYSVALNSMSWLGITSSPTSNDISRGCWEIVSVKFCKPKFVISSPSFS